MYYPYLFTVVWIVQDRKFVSDLWQVCGYSQGTPVSYTNKTDHHNITDKHYKPKLYTLWISIEDSVLYIWKKE
jgi:hypothetical protein